MEKLVGIRGAITVKENDVNEIKDASCLLLSEILKENKLDKEKIVTIIFTVTSDLDSINPATIVREKFQLGSTAMICVQEMRVKNELSRCIRILVQAYTNLLKDEVKHVYLNEAQKLRPDLSSSV